MITSYLLTENILNFYFMNSNQKMHKFETDSALHAEDKINSEVLMSGKKEITIVHNKEEYKLRLTGNDKLILTK